MRVADQVDGLWSAAIASHAIAVTTGETNDLERAAEAFGAMGSSLVAGELWASVSTARQQEGLRGRAADAARNRRRWLRSAKGRRRTRFDWPPPPNPYLGESARRQGWRRPA